MTRISTIFEAPDFSGAKLAIFVDDCIVVIRRDDLADIPWPGLIDLPGGGREGRETPVETAIRETREEVGLVLTANEVLWARAFSPVPPSRLPGWLLATGIDRRRALSMQLGDEGQACWLMPLDEFLIAPDGIPHIQARVRVCLSDRAQV